MTNYKKILKQINKDELEEFMLEIIIENPYIKEKFEIRFSRIFSKKI